MAAEVNPTADVLTRAQKYAATAGKPALAAHTQDLLRRPSLL